MIDAHGRTLTFSAFANDVPGGGSATAALDAALLAVAAGG
jgi:D-alanyl-D-alanine carboxypeptidase/D-alanyl-D-alanine-endopeptidase (penicillin-binding protein 4)